jgi:BetI-type transcriptional repressor, C-terminal
VADLDEARTRVAAAGTAVEKMDVLMDYVLDDASDDASALWLEAWSLGRRDAPLAAEAKELTDEWLSVIGETVRIGTGDGEFRVADVDVAARRLLTVIDGLGAQKVVRAVPSEEAKHIARAYFASELGVDAGPKRP